MSEAPSVRQDTQAAKAIGVVAGGAASASSSSVDKRSAEPVPGGKSGSASAFGRRLHSALSDDASPGNGTATTDPRASGDAGRAPGAANTAAETRRSPDGSPDGSSVSADDVNKPSSTVAGARTAPGRSSAPSVVSPPQQTPPAASDARNTAPALIRNGGGAGPGPGNAPVSDVGVLSAAATATARAQAAAIDQHGVETAVDDRAAASQDTAIDTAPSVSSSDVTDAASMLAEMTSTQPGSASSPVSIEEQAGAELTALAASSQLRAVTPAQGSSPLPGTSQELAAQQAVNGGAAADEARVVDATRPETAAGRASSASDAAVTNAEAALNRQSGRRDGTLQVSASDGRSASLSVASDANTSSAGNSGQQEADPRSGKAAVPISETVNGLLESDKQRLQEFLERQPDARSSQHPNGSTSATAAGTSTPALIQLAAGGWAVPAGINPALMLSGGEPLSPTTPTAPSSMAMFGQAPQAAFGENVRWMVQQGLSSASFTVTPQGMGPVSVTLDMEKDGLQIAIHSAQATTREALDLLLPRLREQLQAAGYDQVNVDVSDGGQQHPEKELNEESGTDTALSNVPESASEDTSSEIDAQSAAMHPGIRGGWHRGMFDITV